MPGDCRATELLSCTPGSQLYCRSHSYMVQSFLGEGTYGKVAKCIRKDTNKTVAVKLIKRKTSIQKARLEVFILENLSALIPYSAPLLHLNHSFMDRGHLCLEFDLLDMDLWNFMKQRDFFPMSLNEIRPILHQLASGLRYLKNFRIIHADLKPENIMLVDHRVQPHRVKIIDFGIAHYRSAVIRGSYIQSLTYRSPEVILGLPYTEAIDMWSLGCVAACLFLGFNLFNGSCEYEMMSSIVEVQGQPPDKLLKYGSKTRVFFTTSANNLFRLKTLAEFYPNSGFQPATKMIFKPFNSLDDLVKFNHLSHWRADNREVNDLWSFVELLKGMLVVDAINRFTPRDVVAHQFFSICQTPQPVLLLNPSSSTAHAAWQNVPPELHQFNPRPLNSTQTQWTRDRVSNEVEPPRCSAANLKKRIIFDFEMDGHCQPTYSRAQPRKKTKIHRYVNPHTSNWRSGNVKRFDFNGEGQKNTNASLHAFSSSKAAPSSGPHSRVNPAQVCGKVIPSAPAVPAPESSSCAQDCRDAQGTVRSSFHAAAASLTSNTHCQAAAKKATLKGSKCSKGKKRKAQTSTSQGNVNQFIVSWYSQHLPEFMPCMGIESSK